MYNQKFNRVGQDINDDEWSYRGLLHDPDKQVANYQGNQAWDALGLDPDMYSANTWAQRKGLQLGSADLQAALVERANSDHAAQLEYDLSKQMYDETQSWQAQVEQMREAGINPMFGVTGGNTTGGADAPSVESAGASNTGSAIQGASNMLGVGQIAVDAFRQAMAVPMLAEQARGMRIANNREQAMEVYYRQQIVADTERKQAEAKISAVNALVAESTKDDKIEQASIDTEAKRLGLEGQKFDNQCKEYQSKIMKLDSDNKQKFIDLDLRMMKATLRKNNQEIKNLQQEAIKLAKECDLLDKDIKYADEREFLAYMNVFNGYISSMSQRISAGASLGMYLGPQYSGYIGKSAELIDGAFGSGLASVRQRWGNSGFYKSAGPQGKYKLIHGYEDEPQNTTVDVDELLDRLNNSPMWTYGLDNTD